MKCGGIKVHCRVISISSKKKLFKTLFVFWQKQKNKCIKKEVKSDNTKITFPHHH